MNKKNNELKKCLTPLGVTSLALGSIIGWGAFVMPGDYFLLKAGPLGTAIGMTIGMITMIIVSISYGNMIEEYPLAGGEFTFAYESFGKAHGFICAWFLTLSYILIVPLNATALGLIGRYMFPGILQRGYMYSVAGWEVYFGEIAFSSLVLLIIAIITIKGIDNSGKLQTIMTFTLILSVTAIVLMALISKKTSIMNLNPLFSPEVNSINGILSISIIAPWAYIGFDTVTQSSEEFNFSHKKTTRIMIFSIVMGGFIYISLNTVTASLIPWYEFVNSQPIWATGYVVEELMGKTGLIVLGIALISAIISGIIGFYIASSRLLLAISRENFLPKWFKLVHKDYKTPINSIKFVLSVSLIAPWFGRQALIWIVDMASIGAAIGYFYTCTSSLKLSLNKKDNKILKLISFMGTIISLIFIILLIVPGTEAYLGLESRIALTVWILLGIIFLFKSRIKFENFNF